ncbi:MAG TPA: N-acetylmuramoyl-L-alanine amidase, partial [Pedobacter sp.]|nr:N-acetylmuramoyl-L-alanine amidase [Pedobacter sp.]
SPNTGGTYQPQYLVMHYTAATTASSAISWFKSPVAQASAHLVIGRDGAVTQCAPFNVVTWHAGKSQWKGLIGLNKHSIGIELVNAGKLVKAGERFICAVDRKVIDPEDVIRAKHKNETSENYWQEYTAEQMEVSLEIAALLVKQYSLKDVIGHEDIAPIRKSDPGPAFPMSSFRARAIGRANESLDESETSTILNIRSGPGSNFPTLTDPLPKGTKVLVLKTEGTWSFVEVVDVVHGIMDLEGWVSTKYLI